MKWMREITEWAEPTPNHLYLLSDDKSRMIAYIKEGTNEHMVFSKPMRFDARGRKFKEVKRG